MHLKTFLQLLSLSALWGGSFPIIRVASPLLGASMLSLLRIAIATLTLSILMRVLGQRWPWKDWKELSVIGALAVAIPFFLLSWAALSLPSGYIALFNTTAVIFGSLTSAFLKQDRLTLRKLAGGACGFLGIGLIVQLGPVHPTPEILMGAASAVLGALCFGVSMPLMARATRRLEPLAIAGPMYVASLVFMLPAGLLDLPQARFTPTALLIVAILGVVNSTLAFWMHLRIMRQVTPIAAMSPIFMVPVFGVIAGSVFLGEKLSPGIYLGGALVLMAAALVTGFNPFRRRTDLPPPLL